MNDRTSDSQCFSMGWTTPKLSLPWPPPNTWLLGHTRVSSPNGISISSVVFAELTNVTDRQTTAAMRPNNSLRILTVKRLFVRRRCELKTEMAKKIVGHGVSYEIAIPTRPKTNRRLSCRFGHVRHSDGAQRTWRLINRKTERTAGNQLQTGHVAQPRPGGCIE